LLSHKGDLELVDRMAGFFGHISSTDWSWPPYMPTDDPIKVIPAPNYVVSGTGGGGGGGDVGYGDGCIDSQFPSPDFGLTFRNELNFFPLAVLVPSSCAVVVDPVFSYPDSDP